MAHFIKKEKPVEKTEFKVKLEKFDAASKAKIIKEIKGMIPGANLVEVYFLTCTAVLCANADHDACNRPRNS